MNMPRITMQETAQNLQYCLDNWDGALVHDENGNAFEGRVSLSDDELLARARLVTLAHKVVDELDKPPNIYRVVASNSGLTWISEVFAKSLEALGEQLVRCDMAQAAHYFWATGPDGVKHTIKLVKAITAIIQPTKPNRY